MGVFLGLGGKGVKGVKVRLELAPGQCGALGWRGRRALHQSTLAINNASATEGGPQEAQLPAHVQEAHFNAEATGRASFLISVFYH